MLDNPDYWLSYHDLAVIDKNWILKNQSRFNTIYKEDTSFLFISTMWACTVATSMMFKIKYIDNILPMPIGIYQAQDCWTILILSLLKTKIYYINKSLAYYRSWHNSMQKKFWSENWKKRNSVKLCMLNFLWNRFYNKEISLITNYNEDRLKNWGLKKIIHYE